VCRGVSPLIPGVRPTLELRLRLTGVGVCVWGRVRRLAVRVWRGRVRLAGVRASLGGREGCLVSFFICYWLLVVFSGRGRDVRVWHVEAARTPLLLLLLSKMPG
jgi:hypothetical protein